MLLQIKLLLKIDQVSLWCVTKKYYFSSGICKSLNRLDKKTVILTGGNTGIGYETAIDLAKRGFKMSFSFKSHY